MSVTNEQRIALLIDCDNVSYRSAEGVLDELSKYGKVNVRLAYGNWKSEQLRGWEEQLHPLAIKPIQQFAYTSGKNATDAAMIIDAMDLLYTGNADVFALMTSDSDFTPLVMRLLAEGKTVYGFGEKKTPMPFVKACSQFIYTENLEHDEAEMCRAKYRRSARCHARHCGKTLRWYVCCVMLSPSRQMKMAGRTWVVSVSTSPTIPRSRQ